MIFIIDDNDFRREKICKSLYMDSIPAIGCKRGLEKGYFMPIITIIIDPKPNEYNKIYNGNGTTYYFCAKRPIPNLPKDRVIIVKDCFLSPNDVRKILSNDFQINFSEDYVGPIALYHEIHSIFVGGAYIGLNQKQFDLISLLVYNYGKRFSIDEIYAYLHFKNKLLFGTFKDYISVINSKSKHLNRGKLIDEYKEVFYLSDSIVNAIRKVKLLQEENNTF